MTPFPLWWSHETRCHNKEGLRKIKSFSGYTTRDKEVYWRISQKPPLSSPFRLTTPLSCSSFILVSIIWHDLPFMIAICVVVMNLSDTNNSIFCFRQLYDFSEVSVQSLSDHPVHYCFCIISITYIHAFNGIYYMNSCAIIVKNQAITQVFQYLWYIYSIIVVR